jgi:hypothetical protein
VCFSIDDIHPGTSRDAYEAGGDMERGSLGVLRQLQDRQPQLRTTLFATPDWRQTSPFPTQPRAWLAKVPFLGDRLYLAPTLPQGTMAFDRHPAFVRYLASLPHTEIALHGLHHIHPGPKIPVEFQAQGEDQCAAMLREGQGIFRKAGLPPATGMQPPAWNTPDALVRAAQREGLLYLACARDIVTPISADATSAMSGPRGMSLVQPQLFPGTRVVHLCSNFQATSPPERALQILELGGLLCVKGHIVKQYKTYVALDAVDELYCNYLDLLLDKLHARFGDALWFATMDEVARAYHAAHPT